MLHVEQWSRLLPTEWKHQMLHVEHLMSLLIKLTMLHVEHTPPIRLRAYKLL